MALQVRRKATGTPTGLVYGQPGWDDAHGQYAMGRADASIKCAPALLYANTADSSAVASTTSETDFSLTTTLAADYLRVGRRIRVVLAGKYGTTATPRLQFRVKLGSVTVVDLGAVACLAAASDEPFCIEAFLTCRTAGGSGTVQGVALDDGTPIAAPATVDTTASNVLKASAQWSASHASNTVTLQFFHVEALN